MIRCIAIFAMYAMVALLASLVLGGVDYWAALLAGSSTVEHSASIARRSLPCGCVQLLIRVCLGVDLRWLEHGSATRSRNCDLVCLRSVTSLRPIAMTCLSSLIPLAHQHQDLLSVAG